MKNLNQAICYHEHGDPFDVLSSANVPLENLGPREVRIEEKINKKAEKRRMKKRRSQKSTVELRRSSSYMD